MRRSATVSLFLLLSPPVALRIATLVLPTFCSDRDSESQAAHPRLPDRVLAARALRAPNAPNPAQHQEPSAPAGCSVGSGAATGRVPAPARPSSAGAPSVGASPRRRGRRYLVDRPLGPPRLRGKRPWHTVGDGAEGALQDLASLTRLTGQDCRWPLRPGRASEPLAGLGVRRRPDRKSGYLPIAGRSC
jgi:hypothetical protein